MPADGYEGPYSVWIFWDHENYGESEEEEFKFRFLLRN
jgi:hypothetical protein